MVTKTTQTYRKRYSGASVSTATANETVVSWNVPPLVKGSWVDLGNGNRFRTPTDYSRQRLSLTLGSRMKSEGYRKLFGGALERYGQETSEGGYGIGEFFAGGFVYRYSNALSVPNLLGPPDFATSERNEAVTKALNKIADQKVNIGENLATLGQTCRMFISPVSSFVGLTKKYHNLPVGREIPWGKLARMSYRDLVNGRYGVGLAQRYLEYVYGFAPLMQDIHEISKMAKSEAAAPLLFNGRAKADRSGSAPDQHRNNISAGVDEYWTGNAFESTTRCTLWAKLNANYALSRTLNQLSLLNPASLVWELVPYSFVVDWILPIGPVLSAMTAPAGLDFVGGSVSRRVKSTWNYSIQDQAPGSSYFFTSNSPASGSMRYDGYRRQRLSTWPSAGLWFASDPLGLHRDGSDRLIKALALAIARLPKSL